MSVTPNEGTITYVNLIYFDHLNKYDFKSHTM